MAEIVLLSPTLVPSLVVKTTGLFVGDTSLLSLEIKANVMVVCAYFVAVHIGSHRRAQILLLPRDANARDNDANKLTTFL